jgi:predicted flavoprotein YhiN
VRGQTLERLGECIVSENGIEGTLIYALSRPFREMLNATGSATFYIDLLPDHAPDRVLNTLCHRGSKSLSSHLKSALGEVDGQI